jgi:predicted RNA-binding protein YlqC (UPF0109 family)
MKDLVLHLVKNLAEHPDKVGVEESDENGVTRLQLTVAEEDKGKIIGKQGKVIKAIRAVATAAASKAGKKVAVDLD